jgi:hypothetical protein
MAKGKGAGSGQAAGLVYVRLSADLTQLEADLKRAQGSVDKLQTTVGKGGGSAGVKDAAAEASARKETLAIQQRQVETERQRAAATRSTGFASRESARDVRQQVATIKDQLNDTTAFSGAGFSDMLFGIDNDRIAATRFGGALADLQKQKIKLDAALQSNPGSKALQAELAAVNKGIATNQAGLDGIQKKWSGVGGAVRGAGATIATSLASSLLIGAGIGLATTAISALASAGMELGDKLANPAKYAASAFNDLAAAVNKAGGSDAFAKLLGLTGPLRDLASAASSAAAASANQANLQTLGAAASSAGYSGLSPAQAISANNQTAFTDSVLSGITMAGNIPIGLSPEKATSIAKLLGTEAFAAFQKDIERQKGTLFSGTFTTGLVDSLRVASKVAFQELQNAAAQSVATSTMATLNSLASQRAMITGETGSAALSVQDRAILFAQKGVAGAQSAMNAFNARRSARGDANTLSAAQTDVVRAGIATGGTNGFEVAAAIAEARQKANEVRTQIAENKKSNQYLAGIASAQKKLAAAQTDKQLADIDKQIVNLATPIAGIGPIVASSVVTAINAGTFSITVDAKSGALIGNLVTPTVSANLAKGAGLHTRTGGQ